MTKTYKNNRHIICAEVVFLAINVSMKTEFFPVGEVWTFFVANLNKMIPKKTQSSNTAGLSSVPAPLYLQVTDSGRGHSMRRSKAPSAKLPRS